MLEQLCLGDRAVQREKEIVRRFQSIEQHNLNLLISQLKTKLDDLDQTSEKEAEAPSLSTEILLPEPAGVWPHHDDISEDDSQDD